MYRVYEKSAGYKPVFIAYYDHEEIKGLIVAVIIKESFGPFSSFTSRCIINGGPLILDNDQHILDEILKKFDRIVKSKAIYSQFRNMWERNEESGTFSGNGFEFDHHLDILIDLGKSIDTLWDELDSKARNKIRIAEKNGLTYRFMDPGEQTDTVYRILKEVYSRARLPLPDIGFFRSAIEILFPKKYLKIVGIFADEELVAVRLLLCYRERVYDWYAGSLKSMQYLKANDLSPWAAIKSSKMLGYHIFDWGGAGKPGIAYNVRDFKKKYGGETSNPGRFVKVNNRLMMTIGKAGLKLYQKFYR
jgi:serine/alanine adding enzyme